MSISTLIFGSLVTLRDGHFDLFIHLSENERAVSYGWTSHKFHLHAFEMVLHNNFFPRQAYAHIYTRRYTYENTYNTHIPMNVFKGLCQHMLGLTKS